MRQNNNIRKYFYEEKNTSSHSRKNTFYINRSELANANLALEMKIMQEEELTNQISSLVNSNKDYGKQVEELQVFLNFLLTKNP